MQREIEDTLSEKILFDEIRPGTWNIDERIKGNFNYGNGRVEKSSPLLMKFWRDHASYPFKSHDLWFLTEDVRWGVLPPDLVLGTSPASIDAAEDRNRWGALCARLEIPQPAGGTAITMRGATPPRRQHPWRPGLRG